MVERVDQAQLLRLLGHRDGVAGRAGEVVLAVAGHQRIDRQIVGHDNLQFAIAVHHDGPAGQRMRVHRHDDHGIQLGVHDRPAGGQRVGGGAGRRGDDQAVGLLTADEVAVDEQLELDHLGRLARVQHHIVERIALADGLAVAADLGLQQEAAFLEEAPFQHLGDLDLQLVRLDVGEKTQAATVDAQHRDLVAGQGARGAEHAAVAADHHDQVADLAEDLPRTGLQAMTGQHFGDGVLEDHMQVTLEQELLQAADGVEHLGAAQAADDADIAKLLHGALCNGGELPGLWAKALRSGKPGAMLGR